MELIMMKCDSTCLHTFGTSCKSNNHFSNAFKSVAIKLSLSSFNRFHQLLINGTYCSKKISTKLKITIVRFLINDEISSFLQKSTFTANRLLTIGKPDNIGQKWNQLIFIYTSSMLPNQQKKTLPNLSFLIFIM